jgi:putative DNA primase/helicase
VLVEGEKTADAAQRLLPNMVAMTWAGGAKAYQHTDFAPLAGRKVICIPDADAEGRAAFHGRTASRGRHVSGILEILADIGGIARCVEPSGMLADGWDLADAEVAGWDTARTIAWIKTQLGKPAPCRMTGTSR